MHGRAHALLSTLCLLPAFILVEALRRLHYSAS